MPLYLERWPGLCASLVSARDEEDLLDTLDQVDDSEGATWSVYRGPRRASASRERGLAQGREGEADGLRR